MYCTVCLLSGGVNLGHLFIVENLTDTLQLLFFFCFATPLASIIANFYPGVFRHSDDFFISIISSLLTNWNSAVRKREHFLSCIYSTVLIIVVHRYLLYSVNYCPLLWLFLFPLVHPDLAIGSSVKLAPGSFWHSFIICWVRLYFPAPQAVLGYLVFSPLQSWTQPFLCGNLASFLAE